MCNTMKNRKICFTLSLLLLYPLSCLGFGIEVRQVDSNHIAPKGYETIAGSPDSFFVGVNQQGKKMLDQANNQKFFDQYGAQKGINKTASGMLYRVLKAGDGQNKPSSSNSSVTVNYEGKLIDGKVFDSSYKRNQPATFRLNQVIPGWTEALLLMSAGDVWEVLIPANLAYGSQGAAGVIPPNSPLIFKIELIEVHN